MAKIHIELSGPNSVNDGEQDALATKKAPKGRSAGKESKAAQKVSVLPSEPAEISDEELARDHARSEKRRATEHWIAGRMTTSDHEKIHRRADHVLKNKSPKHFKGPSGERKSKHGLMW